MKSSPSLSGLAAGLCLLLAGMPADAQNHVDAARTAWEKAKADLGKAQDAYAKATEAYVKAVQTPAPVASPPPATPSIPTRTVNFVPPKMGGIGMVPSFRARVVVDGKALDWRSFSGLSSAPTVAVKAAPAKTLAYEVERVLNTQGLQGGAPTYRYDPLCKGNLAVKDVTSIAVQTGGCTVK